MYPFSKTKIIREKKKFVDIFPWIFCYIQAITPPHSYKRLVTFRGEAQKVNILCEYTLDDPENRP